MVKHLTGLGKNWDIFLDFAVITYNTYSTPDLDNFSCFEITLDRKAKLKPKLEVTSDVPVSGTFKDAYTLIVRKLKYFREHLQKFRDK